MTKIWSFALRNLVARTVCVISPKMRERERPIAEIQLFFFSPIWSVECEAGNKRRG